MLSNVKIDVVIYLITAYLTHIILLTLLLTVKKQEIVALLFMQVMYIITLVFTTIKLYHVYPGRNFVVVSYLSVAWILYILVVIFTILRLWTYLLLFVGLSICIFIIITIYCCYYYDKEIKPLINIAQPTHN